MNLHETTTLFATAELVADSVLHIGSGDHLDYRDVSSLYRDGRGLPVIPGSSLAGVFSEAALPFKDDPSALGDLKPLWRRISGKSGARDDYDASALEFGTLPLLHGETMSADAWSQVRDLVRLDGRTRTAAHGAKFAFEVLEPGLRFRLVIRCNLEELDNDEARATLCRLLLAILDRRWGSDGPGGMIGANSARGMGWFHIENLRFVPIDSPEALREYLDNNDDGTWLGKRISEGRALDAEALEKVTGRLTWRPSVETRRFTLTPRQEPDDYGCWPAIVRSAAGGESGSADFEFTTVRRWRTSGTEWTSSRVPVIPGSSVRGAARALLERLAKAGHLTCSSEELEALFGSTDRASPLSFCDALYHDAGHEDPAAQNKTSLERVGLDEFTQGVYGSAKFNYIPLFSGVFQAGLALQSGSAAPDTRLIDALFEWGGDDMPWLGIGAGASPMVWRPNDAA